MVGRVAADDLDVDVQHTAKLFARGQSGAMDEALADYFGNAIEVTARGIAMNAPEAALLCESLCRTGTPQACATRRLDDRRTTVDDYVGAGSSVDNAGVHLNAPIFGGALWDIRRTLDPLTADRLVYRALSAYLTPLDDFVAGRNAVLAAGRDLGLSRGQLRSVAGAFDAHGIRAGWQQRLGVDSHTVLTDIAAFAPPAAAGGHWVLSWSTQGDGGGPAVYTGATGTSATPTSAAPTRLSPSDGRWHVQPATDGVRAAWLADGPSAQGGRETEVLVRPLSGGPIRSVFHTSGSQGVVGQPAVSGDDVAFTVSDHTTGRTAIHLSRGGAPAVALPLPDGHNASGPVLKGGRLAWFESWGAQAAAVTAPTVYSIADGRITAQYAVSGPQGDGLMVGGPLQLAGGRLLWTETPADRARHSAIRSGALDGSGVTDLLSADAPDTTRIGAITASDEAVTYEPSYREPEDGRWTNAVLPKLWQVPLTGGTPQRLSCNRGSQTMAAADHGLRVLWLDATVGRSDLMVRDRPAGRC
ncbi:M4 family metallopeptidase [Kitasatospora sp. NPDC051164]|uniref:M4 family metallopeptidase n=1 Tax=Kitasatospora sp. NPDC051164 TaxID=3364055 RepID=UPI0037A1445B